MTGLIGAIVLLTRASLCICHGPVVDVPMMSCPLTRCVSHQTIPAVTMHGLL